MQSLDPAQPSSGLPDELRDLPFGGLGFDLVPVRISAGSCVAVRTQRADEFMVNGSAEVWQPAGYELLIRLGREIRGR